MNGNTDEELSVILICKEMHWDYWTYLSQPKRFVDSISAWMNTLAILQSEWTEQNKNRIPRHGRI